MPHHVLEHPVFLRKIHRFGAKDHLTPYKYKSVSSSWYQAQVDFFGAALCWKDFWQVSAENKYTFDRIMKSCLEATNEKTAAAAPLLLHSILRDLVQGILELEDVEDAICLLERESVDETNEDTDDSDDNSVKQQSFLSIACSNPTLPSEVFGLILNCFKQISQKKRDQTRNDEKSTNKNNNPSFFTTQLEVKHPSHQRSLATCFRNAAFDNIQLLMKTIEEHENGGLESVKRCLQLDYPICFSSFMENPLLSSESLEYLIMTLKRFGNDYFKMTMNTVPLLDYVCLNANAPVSVVEYLVKTYEQLGGEKPALPKVFGLSKRRPFSYLCKLGSGDVIQYLLKALLRVNGPRLVQDLFRQNSSALTLVCASKNVSVTAIRAIVEMMIEVEGFEYVWQQCKQTAPNSSWTPFIFLLRNTHASTETFKYVFETFERIGKVEYLKNQIETIERTRGGEQFPFGVACTYQPVETLKFFVETVQRLDGKQYVKHFVEAKKTNNKLHMMAIVNSDNVSVENIRFLIHLMHEHLGPKSIQQSLEDADDDNWHALVYLAKNKFATPEVTEFFLNLHLIGGENFLKKQLKRATEGRSRVRAVPIPFAWCCQHNIVENMRVFVEHFEKLGGRSFVSWKQFYCSSSLMAHEIFVNENISEEMISFWFDSIKKYFDRPESRIQELFPANATLMGELLGNAKPVTPKMVKLVCAYLRQNGIQNVLSHFSDYAETLKRNFGITD